MTPAPRKPGATKRTTKQSRRPAFDRDRPIQSQVEEVLAWLARRGTKRNREGMARFAIPSHNAFGVSVADLREFAKRVGKSHELALALWKAAKHETRMLGAFVDDPALVTLKQMDSWCRDFDNWALCDTVCFHLFDRTPYAFRKIEQWAKRKDEFVKRAAFALLASVALHDKVATNAEFVRCLPLIENAASDERNFVKKAVNWALRGVGERNTSLHKKCLALSKRLAASEDRTCRWVGKGALRELSSEKVAARLARRAAK